MYYFLFFLFSIYACFAAENKNDERVLTIGCGERYIKKYSSEEWKKAGYKHSHDITLDIDKECNPNIVGNVFSKETWDSVEASYPENFKCITPEGFAGFIYLAFSSPTFPWENYYEGVAHTLQKGGYYVEQADDTLFKTLSDGFSDIKSETDKKNIQDTLLKKFPLFGKCYICYVPSGKEHLEIELSDGRIYYHNLYKKNLIYLEKPNKSNG